MLQMKFAKAFFQQIFLLILTSIWQDPSSLGNSGLSPDKYFLDLIRGFRFKTKGDERQAQKRRSACLLSY